MASQLKVIGRAGVGQRARAGGLGLDWATAGLCGWLIGGVYLDGWAHTHHLVDSSFFTPWHAVLYAGYGAVALLLGAVLAVNLLRGYTWDRAMPPGYLPGLFGAAVFALGGVGDMAWHTLFGIELNMEALLSPTHLLLALGATLMVTSPPRAVWRRPAGQSRGWRGQAPMLIGLALLLALLGFFTQYLHPLVDTWPQGGSARSFSAQALGMGGILLQSALLMGVGLLVLRRGPPPLGAWTLLVLLPAALISVIHDEYRLLPGVLVAGLVGDALLVLLRPSAARPLALRCFAFMAPAVLYGCYFTALAADGGINWSIHMWSGAILLAGVVGLLLSFLVMPPQEALPDV